MVISRFASGIIYYNIEGPIRKALKFILETKVLEKIKSFGWRLLQNKLPTRLQHRAHNVLHDPHDLGCVFYFHQDEDQEHLFLHLPIVKTIWMDLIFSYGHVWM